MNSNSLFLVAAYMTALLIGARWMIAIIDAGLVR